MNLNIDCHFSCNACKDGTSKGCLNCSSPLILLDGQCLSKCPEGYFKDNDICEKCKSPCKSCKNLVECKSCVEDSYLVTQSSICVSKEYCPVGTYPNDITWVCELCDFSCERCFGQSPDQCKTCMVSLGYAEKLSPRPGRCHPERAGGRLQQGPDRKAAVARCKYSCQ